jgi:hypothetical protein
MLNFHQREPSKSASAADEALVSRCRSCSNPTVLRPLWEVATYSAASCVKPFGKENRLKFMVPHAKLGALRHHATGLNLIGDDRWLIARMNPFNEPLAIPELYWQVV